MVTWEHTWQRKDKRAWRAKAMATHGKALAKIVARDTGWTRKWEIAGKSEPRRHIAGPHNIVCSGWLAQAASEIVLYAGEMNIFQPMIVV